MIGAIRKGCGRRAQGARWRFLKLFRRVCVASGLATVVMAVWFSRLSPAVRRVRLGVQDASLSRW